MDGRAWIGKGREEGRRDEVEGESAGKDKWNGRHLGGRMWKSSVIEMSWDL